MISWGYTRAKSGEELQVVQSSRSPASLQLAGCLEISGAIAGGVSDYLGLELVILCHIKVIISPLSSIFEYVR